MGILNEFSFPRHLKWQDFEILLIIVIPPLLSRLMVYRTVIPGGSQTLQYLTAHLNFLQLVQVNWRRQTSQV